ncbi:MAG: L,D-transpeptidase family protein [Clostridiaceae bacterium]
MADIIALLYLLITLHTSGIDTSEPVFVQKVFAEIQLNGTKAAYEKLQSDLPALLAEAGINIPVETLDDCQDKQSIDPMTVDYEKELRDLGYFTDENNDAKLNLRNAVLRFQSSCNLKVDGIWGEKSLEALIYQLSTGNSPVADVVAAPPPAGKWLVINKSNRILTLYENSSILRKYPVAIGNPPSLTPNGKFTIVSKVINPAWGGGGYAKPVKGGIPANPLGYRWLGLSYKTGDELGIHGNNSPYSIGKNISHGCIRMINSDVEQLFEIIPRTAEVWIGDEAVLLEWGVVQKNSLGAAGN